MFSRKCSKCKNKADKSYDFCPYCGNNLNSKTDSEDYGFLGKNDFIEKEMFPGIEDSFMDKMLNNAFKMAEKILEKQMKALSEEMMEKESKPKIQNNIPGNVDIQFFVNGKKVFPQIPNQGNQEVQEIKKQKIKTIKMKNISEEKAEKFSKLPKKEPSSKVRRLSGKIIYELEVPGVKNIEDVLINQLENSIEIKALGKDKVYLKNLNVNLPILKYSLEKGSLVLELQA
ncbi:Uncharacterised protein [uncultured archaeon]|nr:Uncharacterised protein [uncultured archaeon]